MKKFRLFAAILLAALALSLCGCSNSGSGNDIDKKVLTPDEFMDIMVAEGYNIYDISSQLTIYEDIETVYVATTGDELYQIEFYKLCDEEAADALFVGNQVMFEEYKSGAAYTDYDLSLANFAIYKLTVNGRYMVISRVENTMVYVDAPVEFKDDIDAALKALGY